MPLTEAEKKQLSDLGYNPAEVDEQEITSFRADFGSDKAKEVLGITSDKAREQTYANRGQLANISQQLEQIRQQALKVQETAKTLPEQKPAVLVNPQTGEKRVFQSPDINKQNIESLLGQGYQYESGAPTITPTITPTAPAPDALSQSVLTEYNRRETELKAQMEKLKTSELSSSAKLLIEDIQRQYEDRVNVQKDINQRALAAQNILGIRTGLGRYAPQLQTNIMTETERKGMEEINRLDSERTSLIAKAKAADETKNYTALNTLMESYNTLQDKKITLYEKLQKEIQKQNEQTKEEATTTEKRITAQSQIIDLFQSGIQRPDEIFDAINRDESGQLLDEPIASFGDITQVVNALKIKQTQVKEKPANLLTLNEVKSLKLPVSLVGLSQEQVLSQLQESAPPKWFEKYIEGEVKADLTPEALSTEWEKFRAEVIYAGKKEEVKKEAGGEFDFGAFNLPPPIQ